MSNLPLEILREWTPAHLFQNGSQWSVRWCNPGKDWFGDPFWETSVARWMDHPYNLLFGLTTPLAALHQLAKVSPALAPSGFIFHLSRCGSTLLAQMLAASPRNLVISEAAPLDSALQARFRDPNLAQADHEQMVQSIVAAMGQPRRDSEVRYFLKLDSWHMMNWRLLQQLWPQTPWVFIYRDPVEILVSHQRKTGSQMLPRVVPPQVFGWNGEVAGEDLHQYWAGVLSAITSAAGEALQSWPGGCAIDYACLPQQVPELVQKHFKVHLDNLELAQMLAVSGNSAKAPGHVFTPDVNAKQIEATVRMRELAASLVQPAIDGLSPYLWTNCP